MKQSSWQKGSSDQTPSASATDNCELPVERELTWVDMVGRYPAPRECLAAFVATCSAEVLAGIKPANLIRIVRRRLSCGRCMYQLWQQFGDELLDGSSLKALTLRFDAEGVLLLFYRPELLAKRLSGRTMQSFLIRRGYPGPVTLEVALRHLQLAFHSGDSPDEVGMFLGYPAKDVNGFIIRKNAPWQGRCLWRVYGPPARSLRLYQEFCDVRHTLTRRLVAGVHPGTLLKAS